MLLGIVRSSPVRCAPHLALVNRTAAIGGGCPGSAAHQAWYQTWSTFGQDSQAAPVLEHMATVQRASRTQVTRPWEITRSLFATHKRSNKTGVGMRRWWRQGRSLFWCFACRSRSWLSRCHSHLSAQCLFYLAGRPTRRLVFPACPPSRRQRRILQATDTYSNSRFALPPQRVAASSLSDIAKHSPELAQAVVDAGAVAYLAPLITANDSKLKRQARCRLS